MAAHGILKFFRPVRDAAPSTEQQQQPTTPAEPKVPDAPATATTASRKRRRTSTQPQASKSTRISSYFESAHSENEDNDASDSVNNQTLSETFSQPSRSAQEVTGKQGSAKTEPSGAACDASAVARGEIKAETTVAVAGNIYEPEISEYEQKRLAMMAANAAFLQQLGMTKVQRDVLRAVQPVTSSAKRGNSKPKTTVKMMKELLPSRRSQRLRGAPVDGSPGALKTSQREEAADDDEELPVDSFGDSSVLRYSCASKIKVAASAVRRPTDGDGKRDGGETSLIGFSFDASVPAMADPQLRKIYSLSFSPFEENGLIAAGGHQGYVSIYPRDPIPVEYPDSAQSSKAAADNTLQEPLMAFKAHSGWISCVTLSNSVQGEKNILLTTSNDSFLKVWDLNQSSSLSKTAKEVFKTNSLHRNGIFGMDTRDDSLLTCSKDALIAFSQFRDNGSGLDVVHRFEQHDGVVKSVRFSPLQPDHFASGGNDRVLRVFDVRSRNSPVVDIHNAHSRAINSVQWHPTNSNWILSASFDPDLHLFDMRNPALPLFTFRGHYLGSQQNAIYHPAFVENGRAIVAAGGSRCQMISLSNSDGEWRTSRIRGLSTRDELLSEKETTVPRSLQQSQLEKAALSPANTSRKLSLDGMHRYPALAKRQQPPPLLLSKLGPHFSPHSSFYQLPVKRPHPPSKHPSSSVMLSKSCIILLAASIAISAHSARAEEMTFGLLGGGGSVSPFRKSIMQAEKNTFGFSPYAAMAGVDGINNPSTSGGNSPVSAPSGPTTGILPSFTNSNNNNNVNNVNNNVNNNSNNNVNSVNNNNNNNVNNVNNQNTVNTNTNNNNVVNTNTNNINNNNANTNNVNTNTVNNNNVNNNNANTNNVNTINTSNTNNGVTSTNNVNTVNGVTTQSSTTTTSNTGAGGSPDAECGPEMSGRRLRSGCKKSYSRE
ncbi:Nucleosome remodeling factor, subunit caf1/nurf55/msi1, partial [Globisporangium splendens]